MKLLKCFIFTYSLNPCSTGITFLTRTMPDGSPARGEGLNPCSTGITFLTHYRMWCSEALAEKS